MSRLSDRLKRLEARRKNDLGRILVFWDDGTPAMAGITLAEYQALHPDAPDIQMTWGDDDDLRLLPVIEGLAD